jgi:hypothetical protein
MTIIGDAPRFHGQPQISRYTLAVGFTEVDNRVSHTGGLLR